MRIACKVFALLVVPVLVDAVVLELFQDTKFSNVPSVYNARTVNPVVSAVETFPSVYAVAVIANC